MLLALDCAGRHDAAKAIAQSAKRVAQDLGLEPPDFILKLVDAVRLAALAIMATEKAQSIVSFGASSSTAATPRKRTALNCLKRATHPAMLRSSWLKASGRSAGQAA